MKLTQHLFPTFSLLFLFTLKAEGAKQANPASSASTTELKTMQIMREADICRDIFEKACAFLLKITAGY